jgi:hypothetical protein
VSVGPWFDNYYVLDGLLISPLSYRVDVALFSTLFEQEWQKTTPSLGFEEEFVFFCVGL